MGYLKLVNDLRRIVSDKRIRRIVSKRIGMFKKIGKDRRRVFSELCFCILTANYTAEGGIRIQREMGEDFFKLNRIRLAEKLRSLGYRYPKTRANYIVEARILFDDVWRIINEENDQTNIRKWLADNVQGIGFKEASHFLRNIGFKNLAIIDKHVLRVLNRYGLIRRIPKTLSRGRYLEVEQTLSKIADELKVSLAELDLYLWYMDTGKVLK
ncbi:MAG: N-glycosylase/DNA lyase [Thermoproteota archaeon]